MTSSGLLVGDLICLVCPHLETRDLLALRRVNQHWSRWSRLPRCWVSSSWECKRGTHAPTAATWALLEAVCTTAPHLRSLRLPEYGTKGGRPPELDVITRLHLLERLHFGHLLPDVKLVQQLPNLRHVGSFQSIGGQAHRAPIFDALCAKPSLVSLCHLSASALPALGLSLSAPTSLLALTVNSLRGRFDLTPFQALEALELWIYVGNGPLEVQENQLGIASLQALGSTPSPALRVLTIKCFEAETVWRCDELVDALFHTTTLARQLEYLSLDGCSPGRKSIRRIMEECTSLLALHIHRHSNACYQPLTEDEWLLIEGDPPIGPDEVRARVGTITAVRNAEEQAADAVANAASRASVGMLRRTLWNVAWLARVAMMSVFGARIEPPQEEAPPRPDSLELGLFLTGPLAFRQRLLSLSLSVRWEPIGSRQRVVQLRRRMPNLIHVNTCVTPWQLSPTEATATDPWLDQVPSDRQAAAVETTYDFSEQQLDDFRKLKPFHFLRRLKQLASLPLTDSEKDPCTRWI